MKTAFTDTLVLAVAGGIGVTLALILVAFELSWLMWLLAVYAPLAGALYARRRGKRP